MANACEKDVVDLIFQILPTCFTKFELASISRKYLWTKYSKSDRKDGKWSQEAVFTTRLLREFESFEFRDFLISNLFKKK